MTVYELTLVINNALCLVAIKTLVFLSGYRLARIPSHIDIPLRPKGARIP
ncbi:hypothetical protein NIES3585_43360 [Nodularia sp. NIES-3585]|nr:hypothetical protein NIES3585_43360 [Nodularia sp. NIES-3585]